MILFKSSQVGEVLQRLYNSEIDIQLSSEYSEGFTVGMKAHPKSDIHVVNGPKSKSIISTIDAIAFQAAVHYQSSEFAKWYRSIDNAGAKDVPSEEKKVVFENVE